VRRKHLDVLDVAAAVRPERLDLQVGKLDPSVGEREMVVLGPSVHLIAVSRGPPVAVGTATVRFLEEHLILAPKVLLENHALDVRTLLNDALRGPQIGSIELRVVNQLALAGGPAMERLPWLVIWQSVRLQELPSPLRERYKIGSGLPIDRCNMANQPFRAEVVKVAVPQVGSPVAMVPEIVDRDHSKCAHGSERPHFGAAQVVLLIADIYGLTIEAAWQLETASEDVARIDDVEVARIPVHATPTASGRLASAVVPTRIFERHESPRLLLKVAPEVVVQAGRTTELAIDVRQLSARIAQE
jgi:hypothetical protein